MKKLKFFLTVILVCCFAGNAFGQDAAFKIFWTKFKSAVARKDKNAAANLSGFPISMPAFQKSVRTKADFLRRYNYIFNGEANAAGCFQNATPQKASARSYEVNCGFKNDKIGDGGEPIVYAFKLTKSGWKFVGLDNINE
jgi:hypothetical protein